MINKITVYSLISFLITGCTFYYKTADINKNLFDMVKAVNSNHQTVKKGFQKIYNEYNKLKSTDKEEPFFTARAKITSLEKNLEEITLLKNNVNVEYAEFKKYSKGKNKIPSNSQEWGFVKQTKKNMKTLNKEINIKGESFIKKVEDFQDFVNVKITPLVKIYMVSDYKQRYIKTIESLKKLKAENLKLLNDHRLIYKDLEKKYATSNSEECIQLKSYLVEISKKSKQFEFIKRAINALLKTFIEKTEDITEVYSTDPLWDLMQQDQIFLKEKIKEIQIIQEFIKRSYSQFQKLANELNDK